MEGFVRRSGRIERTLKINSRSQARERERERDVPGRKYSVYEKYNGTHAPACDIAKSESATGGGGGRGGGGPNFSNEPTLRVSCAFGAPRLAYTLRKASHISKVVGRGEQFGLPRVSGRYDFSPSARLRKIFSKSRRPLALRRARKK